MTGLGMLQIDSGCLSFIDIIDSDEGDTPFIVLYPIREPLIVDPQSHISFHDRELIHAEFNAIRGPEFKGGPAMYVISPADYDGVEEMVGSKVVGEDSSNTLMTATLSANTSEKKWFPTVTAQFPEKVVLSRSAALAKCSHSHLMSCLKSGKMGSYSWVATFQESSASLTSYSALLRVDKSYITDPGCSSTNADCAISLESNNANKSEEEGCAGPFERSLWKRCAGPKELRKKYFRNLVLDKDTIVSLLTLYCINVPRTMSHETHTFVNDYFSDCFF